MSEHDENRVEARHSIEAAAPASGIVSAQAAMSIKELVAQTALIQQAMQAVMQEGVHFGIIPGTSRKGKDKDGREVELAKPSLLKPGAEKLCLLFRLDPQYEFHAEREGDHLTVRAVCTLYSITSGSRLGSGVGLCTTREKKYAYREGKRTCPECNKPAIFRSKFAPKGSPEGTSPGWYCYAKVDGCGANFAAADDPRIVGQQVGQVANEDLPDTFNTVYKIAAKRAQVAAVLTVTAASDSFTQDLEDLLDAGVVASPAPAAAP